MLTLLSIAFMSVIVTSFITYPKWLDRKPFNCVICMAYWFAFAYQIYIGAQLFEVILYPFAVSYMAYMLKKALYL
jgi:hypothetical protein